MYIAIFHFIELFTQFWNHTRNKTFTHTRVHRLLNIKFTSWNSNQFGGALATRFTIYVSVIIALRPQSVTSG